MLAMRRKKKQGAVRWKGVDVFDEVMIEARNPVFDRVHHVGTIADLIEDDSP